MTDPAPCRMGVDVGGTFTDIVLEAANARHQCKIPTTPEAPEQAIFEGMTAVLGMAHLTLADVGLIIHGTTLATNALVERSGAKTAFITTEGFRDVIETGTESRFDQYDLDIVKPAPLVPRRHRFTVRERIGASGEVLIPLDVASLRALAESLRVRKFESIAVGFMHSFAHPDHERCAAAILNEQFPDIPLSLSSEVSPEIREYERFSTTCANAYVKPMVEQYLVRLEEGLRARGYVCPLFLMLSGGTLTDVATACRFPVRLVESGPAGGAVFAAQVAKRHGLDKVIAFDMGGTTAKLCLIDDGEVPAARGLEVARTHRFKPGSGLPLRVPVTELAEIGAGGGSVGRIDALRRLAVGPESAGASPGPASYGRGGVCATITDANLCLGRLLPDRFAAGRMTLDPEMAVDAVRRNIAIPLGMEIIEAAAGMVEVVDENMANAAREHATERGRSLMGRTLIALGGCAPLHACHLARKLGIEQVIVPASAGVGSALGFLQAPVAYEIARTLFQRLGCFAAGPVNDVFEEMAREAHKIVALGAPGRSRSERRHAYMRYAGQGHELRVELPVRPLEDGDAHTLTRIFTSAYKARYGRLVDGIDVEVLSWTVSVSAATAVFEEKTGRIETGGSPEAGEGRIYDLANSDWTKSWIRHRNDWKADVWAEGSGVIVEDDTATIVPCGFRAVVDSAGDIVIDRPQSGMTATRTASGEVRLQVMWTRLIAVVEEQARTLMSTAFSAPVRESGDLSAGIFDTCGRMIAQAVTGTPGHVNSMAAAVGHFVRAFPVANMEEGDHYISNDPWLCSGHLHDVTMVSPVFRAGRPVALFACTCHLPDIGGLGQGPDGRSLFEEGLFLPIMRFADSNGIDPNLINIIRNNVRVPDEVEGDLHSYMTSNEAGGIQLNLMMDEFGLTSIDDLAGYILERSRAAMVSAIRTLPSGCFANRLTIDGYQDPVDLAATVTVSRDSVEIDFSGSSPASSHGINVVLNYTTAYAAYGIRCVVAPHVPNNAGSLDPISVSAPAGCILNAVRPAPVSARHIIGQFLPDVVMGCLAKAVPERVPAEGASCVWGAQLRGGPEIEAAMAIPDVNRSRAPYEILFFNSGGSGARASLDGLAATAFPSGVRAMSAEVLETSAPVVLWRKELLAGSAGAGRTRGGLGQTLEIGSADGAPFAISAMFDRVEHGACGRQGGENGAPGRVRLASGRTLHPKGFQYVKGDDRVCLDLPGGGGFGLPRQREPDRVAADVANGLISEQEAREVYGVVTDGANAPHDPVAGTQRETVVQGREDRC